MEPAMARVLALSLMAPKLTESLEKISFCTSAWTSSLQEREFLRNALGAPTHPCFSRENKNPCELAQLSVTGV